MKIRLSFANATVPPTNPEMLPNMIQPPPPSVNISSVCKKIFFFPLLKLYFFYRTEEKVLSEIAIVRRAISVDG